MSLDYLFVARIGHDYRGRVVVLGLNLGGRICFSRILVSSESLPFGWVICGVVWVVLWCSLTLAISFVDSGKSWKELWCRLKSTFAYVLPEPFGMSFKEIFRWLPLVLGLDEPGKS